MSESTALEAQFVLLYVENPLHSAVFYQALLGREPLEAAPTFVMFQLTGSVKLGLWARAGVVPAATAPGGGELGFPVGSAAAVDAIYAQWLAQGMPIAQAPTAMDFGYTCVGLDPDGHRLRVFAPGG